MTAALNEAIFGSAEKQASRLLGEVAGWLYLLDGLDPAPDLRPREDELPKGLADLPASVERYTARVVTAENKALVLQKLAEQAGKITTPDALAKARVAQDVDELYALRDSLSKSYRYKLRK